MSNKANNLLKQIKNDTTNPLNTKIKINNSFDGIFSFKGKERSVYGENGRASLENLAREIFVQLYLAEQKEDYEEEISINDQNERIDLGSNLIGKNQLLNVIEVKQIGNSDKCKHSTIERSINDAFNQIKSQYIQKQQNEDDLDSFVSVVVMDVEKIINQPANIERFTSIKNETKVQCVNSENPYQIFKDLGIFIVTKRFNKVTNQFLSDENKHDKMWFDIPVNLLVTKSETQGYNVLSTPYFSAKVIDAVKFPSASTTYGVNNIRDIKDPELSTDKRDLLMSITNTVFEAYSKKQPLIVTKSGKEKDLLYVENETVVKSKNSEEVAISSLSTAIIDGQNSIDCFRLIRNYLINRIENKVSDKKYEDRILFLLEEYGISHEIHKILNFVDNIIIKLSITSAESPKQAREIAQSKNNSMAITKNEHAISKNFNYVSLIASNLFENSPYIITYPKKKNIGISQEDLLQYGFPIEMISQYYELFTKIKNIRKNSNTLGKEMFDWIQKSKNENATKAISTFVNDFTTQKKVTISKKDKENNKHLKSLQKDLDTKQGKKSGLESSLQFITEPKTQDILQDEIEKLDYDISNIQKEITFVTNKMKEEKQYSMQIDVKNMKGLKMFIENIIIIRDCFNRVNELDIEKDKMEIFKTFFNFDKSFFHYVMALSFRYYQDQITFEFVNKDIINKLIKGFVNNIVSFKNSFPNDTITDIRNKKDENAKIYNYLEETEVSLDSVKNDLFDVDFLL